VALSAGPLEDRSAAERDLLIATGPSTDCTGSAAHPGLKRYRPVRVNWERVGQLESNLPQRVRLPLCNRNHLDLLIERKLTLSPGSTAWFGRLTEVRHGSVTLVVTRGVLAACIRAGRRKLLTSV